MSYSSEDENSYIFYKNVIMNFEEKNKESIDFSLMNIGFFDDELKKDETILDLFYKVDNMLAEKRHNINIDHGIKLWNKLFKMVRPNLTDCTIFSHKNSKSPKIFLSFTTCKRIDLFQQTVNSLLKHCEDISMVDYWYCVDDNSSDDDRKKMKELYPWIDFYNKNTEEKGHRVSMNLIYDKLYELKPTYWIHLEDDFLFHYKMPYIIAGIEGLVDLADSNVKQIVFNINYGETVRDYKITGHQMSVHQNYVLHNHNKETDMKYLNCQYWPHYSFRPSITDVSTILQLGNFDSPNTFFEIDYANKWTDAGYKTAFFNRITTRHIGRLTSDRNDDNVKNAYKLNNEDQFWQEDKTCKNSPIKIINLERRKDRKDQTIEKLTAVGITAYEFIKAVDGKTLEPTKELALLFKDNDYGSIRGFIGCALSHYNLWKRLLEDENHSYYLVLEDDFVLCEDFKNKIDKLESEFKEKEVIFLGYHMFERNRKNVKDIYDVNKEETLIFPLNKDLYIGATFGYSINKTGAKNLIDYINKNGIKHGIDYLMKIADTLNSYESQPHLLFSEWNEGGKEIDTDIQNNGDRMNFDFLEKNYLEKFMFCESLDQMNNDLFFQKKSLEEMFKIADENEECMGFNTLGFFKNKIVIEELIQSPYFGKNDGIYVKRDYILQQIRVKRIKMLCNWTTSENLCKEWSNMCEDKEKMRWQNIQLTWSNNPLEIDYYVIINKPLSDDEYYDPKKTIVFQMEPWVKDESKSWGIKTWGKWAIPDPAEFLRIIAHKTDLNNVQWQIEIPNKDILQKIVKFDKISSICSNKNFDTGHILRNNFIKHIDGLDIIDVYAKENYNDIQCYAGPLLGDNKLNGLLQYKYYFMAENNSEYNYATEKIWEPILCECLCFYWGCPNLEDYIDSRAFVRLPLEDLEKSAEIMKQAIDEDWHTQRLPYIREAKEKIMNELGFFPRLKKLLI
jgi:GR25 family glycosyltransferase involved in LPS biosynthesis